MTTLPVNAVIKSTPKLDKKNPWGNFLVVEKMLPDTMDLFKNNNSVGYDIFTYESGEIPAWSTSVVKTHIKMKIPNNTYGRVASKFSMSLNNIEVGAGVIDSDYLGEIMIVLINHSDNIYYYKKNTPIAQIILHHYNKTNYELTDKFYPLANNLLVKKSDDIHDLTKGSEYSAGFDLYSCEAGCVLPWDKKIINTKLNIQLPENTYGRIASRSGLAVKNNIEVGAGVIENNNLSLDHTDVKTLSLDPTDVKTLLLDPTDVKTLSLDHTDIKTTNLDTTDIKTTDLNNILVLLRNNSDYTYYYDKNKAVAQLILENNNGMNSLDVLSESNIEISPWNKVVLTINKTINIPKGFYARIASKLSLSNNNVEVCAGVINNSCSEFKLILRNHSDFNFNIESNKHIAKIVFHKYYETDIKYVKSLSDLFNTNRGEKGFGSSDKK